MPFNDSDATDGDKRNEITAADLGALRWGVDLSQAKHRKRYLRNASEAL